MKGFLLEQKLVSLLEPLEKNEQSMVKLDSIFKSLGVETENDVRLLAQYFINVKQYKELIKNKSYTQQSCTQPDNTDPNLFDFGDDDDPLAENTVPFETVNLIHPNDVIITLKTFLSLNHKNEKYL